MTETNKDLVPGLTVVVLGSQSAIPVTLGEGPCWDAQREILHWVDIKNGVVHSYNPSTKVDSVKRVPGGQKVGAVLNREGHQDQFIVALANGIYSWDLNDDKLQLIQNPEKDKPGNRFNDSKCDPQGRLFAGTMEDEESGAALGSLYRFDPSTGLCETLVKGVGVSNGMAWSIDRTKFYYIDSPTHEVYEFDYDQDTGSISNQRVLFRVENGYPDGMNIDSEGMLWICHWEGGCVTRWDPNTRQEIFRLNMPVSKVTSCCFGGKDLKDLYITSASVGIDLEKEPLAGSLFVYSQDVIGTPTWAYRG